MSKGLYRELVEVWFSLPLGSFRFAPPLVAREIELMEVYKRNFQPWIIVLNIIK